MTDAADHAALMNRVYRRQRLIYDMTRRHYLLGRDHLIRDLHPPKVGHVLEVACGTGRNLAVTGGRYPGVTLYGLDISQEMLTSARARLGGRATLVQGDACAFDAQALFGRARFDRIILSYSLSMIPDWRAAARTATRHLAPGGRLHIVDFSGQAGLPVWFRRALHAWLARFHVAPRLDLSRILAGIAADEGCTLVWQSRLRDYAQYAVITRPAA